jgi:hypothetical protein
MQRRRALIFTASLASAFALGCAASEGGPRYRVSARQLQEALEGRFPARYPVGRLFDLTVQAPRLRFLPEQNRVASEMELEAAGPVLGRTYRGGFDVDFGLRYEPSDRTIRAHSLQVRSMRLEGASPQALQLLDSYGQALAERALLEVVLHRLEPKDLATVDAMGLQPGDITVTRDGLSIGFVPRPLK